MSKYKLGIMVLAAAASLFLMVRATDALAAPTLPPVSLTALLAPNAQGCSGTPTIQYGYANPPVIYPGQVTTIYWGLVGNADAALLQYPNGHQVGIGTPGSQQVNPTQTSTYTIIGRCGGNTAQVPVQVTVQGGPTCQGTPVLERPCCRALTQTLRPSTTDKARRCRGDRSKMRTRSS
jgi:hypothetical protein